MYLCVGVYSFCDGPKFSRGPYLGITTVCSLLSLVFVSLKASYVFGVSSVDQEGYINMRIVIAGKTVVVSRSRLTLTSLLWVRWTEIEGSSGNKELAKSPIEMEKIKSELLKEAVELSKITAGEAQSSPIGKV
ncbi:uncharacterized protein LOC133030879 [Cannabis sativa]|uniref:uncharacterized protein LOC133030879 n=1 Tax=Cannabis sativa TaxID=3483 RepID=UPI0029C9B826|nr:uncharacterized protein LOC133030879 [Cannabis sativa]